MLGELREHEGLVSTREINSSDSRGINTSSLTADSSICAPWSIEKARVARRLPQPQQRLEHRASSSFGRGRLVVDHADVSDGPVVTRAAPRTWPVVPCSISHHSIVCSDLSGSSLDHLLLGPSEDETAAVAWARSWIASSRSSLVWPRSDLREHPCCGRACRGSGTRRSTRGRSRLILDGRSGEGDAGGWPERSSRAAFATCELGVLDRLCLVKHRCSRSRCRRSTAASRRRVPYVVSTRSCVSDRADLHPRPVEARGTPSP